MLETESALLGKQGLQRVSEAVVGSSREGRSHSGRGWRRGVFFILSILSCEDYFVAKIEE